MVSRRKTVLALVVMSCCSTVPAFGKNYKCKDVDGNTVFSDTACNAVAREELKSPAGQTGVTPDQDAIKNCLIYLKSTRQFPDPDSVKVASASFVWVAVKGVGSRRMLHLDVLSKNQYGAYDGAMSLQCLLMGDGRTVSSYPYELLDAE